MLEPKEETMNPLVSLITNGTVQAWEAAAFVAAAIAVRMAPERMKRPRQSNVDKRVLKDIGVEPGSITWIR
jgi:hypothetical protein